MICEKNKKVAYYTLGCKVNFTETFAIKQYFLSHGIQLAKKWEQPDIVIVNTCSVTENADKKCRRLIRHVRYIYPNSVLAVTGCYALLHKNDVSMMKEVDLVFGLDEKNCLLDCLLNGRKFSSISKLDKFVHSYSYGEKTRGFLKIQDGCDYRCSYCIIPLARGKSRNGLILDLVQNAKKMINNGVKEIVLTGVNISDFGKTTGENLFNLIQKLDTINKEVRFRISSIEPNALTNELISFIACSDHFVPHFHISLQSGCDFILQLMNRKYTTDFFLQKIEMIKIMMPNAFIGLDIIVGMRGETKLYFEKTQKFLENLPLSQLHVFPYSERPGTDALKIKESVTLIEKQLRSKQLLNLSIKKRQEFYNSQIGTRHRILFEKVFRNNKMFGFTDNYIRVETMYHEQIVNQFIYGNLRFCNMGKTTVTIDL